MERVDEYIVIREIVIFLGFLKIIKLLWILFIVKLYARSNISKPQFVFF